MGKQIPLILLLILLNSRKPDFMFDLVLSFITAFLLTYFAIPSVINIAKVKHLCDDPDDRRSHTVSTPSLGGVAIFAGIIFSIILWTPFKHFGDLQYILCAFVIIFLIGLKDDILPMSPYKKLYGEIFATLILIYKCDIRLTSLYGIFGITDLPYFASILLSTFTILVIINAINLIDGINGLAGSIGLLITLFFGFWFYEVNSLGLSIVAFSLAGSLLAFLNYNFTPAKIFMGDTGALLIGLVCAILSIKFIELHRVLPDQLGNFRFQAVPSVAIAILIIPLFDTIRVFTKRLIKGKSPLYPDRTHIHHLLLDRGFSHLQATGILVVTNIIFILIAYYFQNIGSLFLLILIISIALIATYLLELSVKRYQKVLLRKELQNIGFSQ